MLTRGRAGKEIYATILLAQSDKFPSPPARYALGIALKLDILFARSSTRIRVVEISNLFFRTKKKKKKKR